MSSHTHLTRPAPHCIVTRRAPLVYDPKVSRALWAWSRTSAALYNLALEHLRTHPDEPLQSDPERERPGLYGMLARWRTEGRAGADMLPSGAGRAAMAQAHAAHARWQETQGRRAEAVLEAEAACTMPPRRVQKAEPTLGPTMRSRKDIDQAGRNLVVFVQGARRVPGRLRRFVAGGVELTAKRGIAPEGDVVSVQLIERTPKRHARAGCAPEERTWAIHVQMRVAVPAGPEVTSVRTGPEMRPVHGLDPERLTAGVVGLDGGVRRAATVALPDGACRHVTPLSEKQREQAKRGLVKAKRMARGTRGVRSAKGPSRRNTDALALRTSARARITRQRRARVEALAKEAVHHPGATAMVIDGAPWKELGRSARGTHEASGTQVKVARAVNRALRTAAPGETNQIFARAAARAGRWTIEGDPATSTACARCGHRAPESRESQPAFECAGCGHADHADDNAARVAQQGARRRLTAYVCAMWERQRREGVASKRARGKWKRVPVLTVLDTTPKRTRGERPQRRPPGGVRATEQLARSV